MLEAKDQARNLQIWIHGFIQGLYKICVGAGIEPATSGYLPHCSTNKLPDLVVKQIKDGGLKILSQHMYFKVL